MPTSAMTDDSVDDHTPGLTFAVADLHGRFDLLQDALVAIEDYPAGAVGRTVVFLGDYVDRGPQSADIVDRLLVGAPVGWRWICLRGNHEAMMATAMQTPDQLDWWISNGGDATIMSYRERRDLVARHLAWIEALPMMHVDVHRVYVHGGVDPAMPLGAQAEETLLWKRYPLHAEDGHGAFHVVHGHDPNHDGPLRLVGRTNLDTLAWATGRLAVGVFDDAQPGGPIDLIEVRRRPA